MKSNTSLAFKLKLQNLTSPQSHIVQNQHTQLNTLLLRSRKQPNQTNYLQITIQQKKSTN